MLIPLHDLVKKYNINFKGVLHIGAHECEELNDYERYLPRTQILWVEALPGKVEFCKNKYPNLLIKNAVVSDTVETVRFNVSNNGQSSSMLDFGLHSQFHPQVHYVTCFETETKLLKDIICNYNIQYNFLNLEQKSNHFSMPEEALRFLKSKKLSVLKSRINLSGQID